jgi:methionyl-tRNA formyltransferase
MRLLFAGSPEIALPSLKALVGLSLRDSSFELAGVLTNPDSSQGRHGDPQSTEVGRAFSALAARLREGGRPVPVLLKPPRLNGEAREAVAALRTDLLVSFAYGRIFGPRFLALFPLGGINIHPSLLPKYRGPAPIPAVILGRERETGVTVQRLALEVDAGDILAQERVPLSGRETAGELAAAAAEKGAAMLEPVLYGLARGDLRGRPQKGEEASYCSLLSKEDGRIDWEAPAADIDARIRAFTPWPLAWTGHGDRYLAILEGKPYEGPPGPPPGTVLGVDTNRGILVQTGEGILGITRLQYRTKKALRWQVFLNGARDFIGSRLI